MARLRTLARLTAHPRTMVHLRTMVCLPHMRTALTICKAPSVMAPVGQAFTTVPALTEVLTGEVLTGVPMVVQATGTVSETYLTG